MIEQKATQAQMEQQEIDENNRTRGGRRGAGGKGVGEAKGAEKAARSVRHWRLAPPPLDAAVALQSEKPGDEHVRRLGRRIDSSGQQRLTSDDPTRYP